MTKKKIFPRTFSGCGGPFRKRTVCRLAFLALRFSVIAAVTFFFLFSTGEGYAMEVCCILCLAAHRRGNTQGDMHFHT